MTKKLDKVLEKYNDLKEELEKAKKKALAPARQALLEDFKTAFEAHPEILSARWTQYTPYFNDGDACVFGVNEMTLASEEDEEIYVGWGADKEKYEDFPDPAGIGDELMEDLFGDHVEVSIGRDDQDFTVDEYSHD